jgi:aspartate-semialdehyde dehydrogenase
MVGSVLVERMLAEKDFEQEFDATFFTTSNVGGNGPAVGKDAPPLVDAYSIKDLAAMDIVVSCQGGDYTKEVHPKLRGEGWQGYWIDAASALRMEDSAIIILDPCNRDVIDKGLKDGVKDYIGGNCTVSLMLMGLGGLFEKGWVEWVSSMTYQAASGAGAANMRELVSQMGAIAQVPEELQNPRTSILDYDRAISGNMASSEFPVACFGAPLAGSLIPWIDKAMDNGQTKEEWKGMAEANKIMNLTGDAAIPIDGCCVRIGAMRCHSQALTIKLKAGNESLSLQEIEAAIAGHNEWSQVVANNKEDTLAKLSPANVSGSLMVPVGR